MKIDQGGMCTTRRRGEALWFVLPDGQTIRVRVDEIGVDGVRLIVRAPDEVRISRSMPAEAVQQK